jgi:hypothetical protein
MFNKGTFSGLQNVPLLNILLGLSPMEVFVKCYKLRATKCNFVEHSSGIISPGSFCKMLQTKGYKMYLCPRRIFYNGTFCSLEFVTLYKNFQGR